MPKVSDSRPAGYKENKGKQKIVPSLGNTKEEKEKIGAAEEEKRLGGPLLFNTLGSCYCLQKQYSACIINHCACTLNVWGYTETFLSPSSLLKVHANGISE